MTFSEYRKEAITILKQNLEKENIAPTGLAEILKKDSLSKIDDICADSWSGYCDWDGVPDSTDYCAILLKNYLLQTS